jgi:hypothetical protein
MTHVLSTRDPYTGSESSISPFPTTLNQMAAPPPLVPPNPPPVALLQQPWFQGAIQQLRADLQADMDQSIQDLCADMHQSIQDLHTELCGIGANIKQVWPSFFRYN